MVSTAPIEEDLSKASSKLLTWIVTEYRSKRSCVSSLPTPTGSQRADAENAVDKLPLDREKVAANIVLGCVLSQR
jgi:hypothetical protein